MMKLKITFALLSLCAICLVLIRVLGSYGEDVSVGSWLPVELKGDRVIEGVKDETYPTRMASFYDEIADVLGRHQNSHEECLKELLRIEGFRWHDGGELLRALLGEWFEVDDAACAKFVARNRKSVGDEIFVHFIGDQFGNKIQAEWVLSLDASSIDLLSERRVYPAFLDIAGHDRSRAIELLKAIEKNEYRHYAISGIAHSYTQKESGEFLSWINGITNPFEKSIAIRSRIDKLASEKDASANILELVSSVPRGGVLDEVLFHQFENLLNRDLSLGMDLIHYISSNESVAGRAREISEVLSRSEDGFDLLRELWLGLDAGAVQRELDGQVMGHVIRASPQLAIELVESLANTPKFGEQYAKLAFEIGASHGEAGFLGSVYIEDSSVRRKFNEAVAVGWVRSDQQASIDWIGADLRLQELSYDDSVYAAIIGEIAQEDWEEAMGIVQLAKDEALQELLLLTSAQAASGGSPERSAQTLVEMLRHPTGDRVRIEEAFRKHLQWWGNWDPGSAAEWLGQTPDDDIVKTVMGDKLK